MSRKKIKVVLEQCTHIDAEGVRLFHPSTDDEDVPAANNLFISNEDWEDMGRPEIVTVTIKPGDHLNESDKSGRK